MPVCVVGSFAQNVRSFAENRRKTFDVLRKTGVKLPTFCANDEASKCAQPQAVFQRMKMTPHDYSSTADCLSFTFSNNSLPVLVPLQ